MSTEFKLQLVINSFKFLFDSFDSVSYRRQVTSSLLGDFSLIQTQAKVIEVLRRDFSNLVPHRMFQWSKFHRCAKYRGVLLICEQVLVNLF